MYANVAAVNENEKRIFTYCFLSTVTMDQSIKMPIVTIYLTQEGK